MAERILEIEAFRNIGFKKENDTYKPCKATLVLDRNFEKGKTGGLVFLIGENGAGKSNILDAIKKFSFDNITKYSFQGNDLSRLAWTDLCQKPEISMSCKMPVSSSESQEYRATKNISTFTKCTPPVTGSDSDKLSKSTETLYSNINTLCEIESRIFNESSYNPEFSTANGFYKIREKIFHNHCNEISNNFLFNIEIPYLNPGTKIYETFLKSVQGQIINNLHLSDDEVVEIKNEILSVFNSYVIISNQKDKPVDYWTTSSYTRKCEQFISEVERTISLGNLNFLHEDDSYYNFMNNFYSKFQVNLIRNVHEYKRIFFSDKDLSENWGSVFHSNFFTALFEAIGVTQTTIGRRYDVYNRTTSYGLLKELEDELNLKIVKVTNDFNRLYNSHIKYSFKIEAREDKVHFFMKKGDQYCILSTESEGFKYFFDLYFGFLFRKDLMFGDIITMDEPAERLSVPALKEVRNFLKDFAFRNGILIVCATHSPFLISADNLDELRLVYCDKDGITTIENEYSLLSNHTHATQEIKRALTTDNYQIIKSDSKYIFVANMDDYNILTAFKTVLGKTDIYFFPIGNVDDKTDIEKLLSEITRLHKQNPVILLPKGDTYDKIKAYCSDNNCNCKALVLDYSRADDSAKTIRDLFTSDISTLNNGTYYFKNHIQNIEKDLQDTTRDKFRELFDYLYKEIDE